VKERERERETEREREREREREERRVGEREGVSVCTKVVESNFLSMSLIFLTHF
jgi:hypothetical protein